MAGLLSVSLVMGRKTSLVFFAFLSFLALKELLSIVPTRQADRRVIFWAYLSIPFQYYWVYIGWYGMFIIFIPVYTFLFLPMRMVLTGETRGFIRAAGIIHWAVMLTVFCLSHIAYLLALPVKNADAGAIGLVLFLLFMTQFNDVCQYIWGKLAGRHGIIPKVSPNKTWEGFAGGLMTITLCGALTGPLPTPLTRVTGLLAGALIGITGFIGDVVISAVKRDLQIKDSGTLIPGHGGILDRLDSLIYTSPIFFHFIYYFYY
jgi:phosphatidate cytidylyltransferase